MAGRKDLIKFSPLLGRLGADPAIYSAVRLTRLANVPRPDKGGFQTLLYLNPESNGETNLLNLNFYVRRARPI